MRKGIYKAAFILCLALIGALAMSGAAFGADAVTNDPAKNTEKGIVYTLTYPDGTVKTTTDYEEAKKMESEMILLYEGKTDKDGKIVLPDWAREGEIKIVEKEVPAGYSAISTETNADLKDGGVTIVNYKDEVVKTNSTDNPGEPAVKTASADGSAAGGSSSSGSSSTSSSGSSSGGSSRTGDSGSPMLMLLLLAAAAAGGGVLIARRRMAR